MDWRPSEVLGKDMSKEQVIYRCQCLSETNEMFLWDLFKVDKQEKKAMDGKALALELTNSN